MTEYLIGLLPELALIAPPFFALGLLAGLRLSTIDREGIHIMGKSARQVYDRLAPWLFLVVFAASAVGVWIGVAGIFANSRQDAERQADQDVRDQAQSALLDCFDSYAAASSEATATVREATVLRDQATARRDVALGLSSRRLGGLLGAAVEGAAKPADVPPVIDALELLRDASADLRAASANLAAARLDNPVPPAPSVFCADTGEEKR